MISSVHFINNQLRNEWEKQGYVRAYRLIRVRISPLLFVSFCTAYLCFVHY